jgi:hypothetical protein
MRREAIALSVHRSLMDQNWDVFNSPTPALKRPLADCAQPGQHAAIGVGFALTLIELTGQFLDDSRGPLLTTTRPSSPQTTRGG